MQDPSSISNKCYRELEYLSAGLTCPYRQHVICTSLPDSLVLPLYRPPVTRLTCSCCSWSPSSASHWPGCWSWSPRPLVSVCALGTPVPGRPASVGTPSSLSGGPVVTDACRSNPLSGPPADSPGHLKQARTHWCKCVFTTTIINIKVSIPTTVESLKLVVDESYMSVDESSLFFNFLKHSLTF